MSIITFDQLKEIDIYNNRLFSERKTFKKKVFLSHSHYDIDTGEMQIAKSILESLDFDVYIDSERLGIQTTRAGLKRVAATIRKEISRRIFILIMTQNSVNSHWVNWELGYADGNTKPTNVYLWPILKKQIININTRGYFDLYQRIEFNKYNNDIWIMENRNFIRRDYDGLSVISSEGKLQSKLSSI